MKKGFNPLVPGVHLKVTHFLMYCQVFFSPQLKESIIISNKHGICRNFSNLVRPLISVVGLFSKIEQFFSL